MGRANDTHAKRRTRKQRIEMMKRICMRLSKDTKVQRLRAPYSIALEDLRKIMRKGLILRCNKARRLADRQVRTLVRCRDEAGFHFYGGGTEFGLGAGMLRSRPT